MAEKKRKFYMALNDVLRAKNKNESVYDRTWEELFSLAESFQQFESGCYWADDFGATKWAEKFLKKMTEMADSVVHWRAVAKRSRKGSDSWKNAIQRAYEMTNPNVYNQWQELRKLLPEDHHLMQEVKDNMSRIRKQKRATKAKSS